MSTIKMHNRWSLKESIVDDLTCGSKSSGTGGAASEIDMRNYQSWTST